MMKNKKYGKNAVIEMNHGAGGRASAELIDSLFISAFDNEWLQQKNDQAAFSLTNPDIVMATDAHVISPLFFPGGDIGSLAVNGTINDVAVAGALPRYLAASFILEEGLLISDLKRIVDSMAAASRAAGVPIVTGDTKVVERGKADGVFITTTGVGERIPGTNVSGNHATPGDKILISGPIGNHGVAILSARDQLGFQTSITSDSASMHNLIKTMLTAVPEIHCLRDPTRGGLATTLNEIAAQSGVGMLIDETSVPVDTEVRSACELLGLDPYYLANEGRVVAICKAAQADMLLSVMQAHPDGAGAAIIGTVQADAQHLVELQTVFGGTRIMDWLTGDPLPRIC